MMTRARLARIALPDFGMPDAMPRLHHEVPRDAQGPTAVRPMRPPVPPL